MSKAQVAKLSAEDKDQICREYLSGWSIQQIRDKYSLFYLEIDEILKAQNVVRREMGDFKSIFSKEEERPIFEKYLAGGTIRGLSREYDVDRDVIKRILTKNSVAMHSREKTNQKKVLDRKGICDAYLAGDKSVSEVAKQYGVTVLTVSRILKKNNIEIKYAGGVKPIGTTSSVLRDNIKKIISLYQDGMSLRKILDTIGSKNSTVTLSRILKENGIQMRTISEQNQQYTCNEKYFEDLGKDQHYILGWIYTDGSIRETPKQSFSIEIIEGDLPILQFIKNEFKSDAPITHHKDHKSVFYSNRSKGIFNALIKCGLTQRKSKTLQFPTWIKDEHFFHFFRGVIEGDGCITSGNTRSLSFCTASEQFGDELAKNVMRLSGIKMTKTEARPDFFKYSVHSYEAILNLGYLMYEDCSMLLPRKYKKFKSICERSSLTRRAIKNIPPNLWELIKTCDSKFQSILQ